MNPDVATNEFEEKRNKLQKQIEQLAQEEKDAKQRAYDEKTFQISKHKFNAKNFRDQAAKADVSDKKNLYTFAADEEAKARELEIELGIPVDEFMPMDEMIPGNVDFVAIRKINSYVWKALFSLLGFFLTDFSSGQLQAGFFSYALSSLSKIAYFFAGALGALWLTARVIHYLVPDYISGGLRDDFESLDPKYKLMILVVLITGIFILLTAIIPHAN